jgi:predicted metalloprotease with PDZ domain
VTRSVPALALLGLVLAPATAAAETPDWSARYRVVFATSKEPAIEATLTWVRKGKARPESVEVGMADDGLPNGYGSYVRDFTPEGRILSTPEGLRRLPVPEDGVVRVRYRVVLAHDPKGWGPGPDEAPYAFEGGAFWTGRALFVTAQSQASEVSFQAPAGEGISVSYEPVPGKAGSYRVGSEQRLRNSFLVVGTYRASELKAGQALVTLALGGEMGAAMPEVEGAVRRFLDASERIFGGAPPARVLVVGNLGASPGSLHGGVFGSDVSFLADEPLSPANAERWRPFLCHEIFHLWNGTAIDFPAGQQYWFTEGVTEYEAHLLPLRLGEASRDAFLTTFAGKAARYLEAAGTTGLLAAGDEKFLNNALVYDGGALAALVLDIEIRAASGNRRSLDDLLRALYERARKKRGLSPDDVTRAASKAAGRPMEWLFERHIRGREPLPLAAALPKAGLDLSIDVSELPETMTILADLLACPSVSVVSEGLKVLRSESPSIRAGDVIVGVNGASVRDFDDLRLAFKDRSRGSEVPLSVLRDGQRTRVDVRLAGDAAAPIERSRHARVTITPRPRPDPLAQQIRTSLLGT